MPTVDSVKSEIDDAIDDAVKHLMTLGHKKAAFIGEPLTLMKQERFLNAAAMQGLKVEAGDVIVAESRFENAGYLGAKKLIEKGSDCTAIVCAYDHIAIGAMRYLEQEGYKIPDDFSIIGMDNIDTSKYLAQSLTTVDSHLEEICTVVADLMAKKVRNRWVTARQEIKISADLIIRESTGKAKI